MWNSSSVKIVEARGKKNKNQESKSLIDHSSVILLLPLSNINSDDLFIKTDCKLGARG